MSKDPSFLFYTQDFLTGTFLMTDEQVGKYIRLLCLQHQTGHLTKDHMLKICISYDKDVFLKFKQDEQGLYYNERLETEINKRNKYCKSRSINRTSEKTYVQHMENEDEEGFKKEGCGGKENTQSNGYITPILFDKFWKLYPRKTDKGKALTKWNQLCNKKDKRPIWKELKSALLQQIETERWKEPKFIPVPTTWLNQSRWLDDPKEMVSFNREEETTTCPFNFIFGKDFDEYSGCVTCEEKHNKVFEQCRIHQR